MLEHSLVTARYVLVWTSPAEFLAKHWNIPVSSGRRPLTCRLPPTSTLYLGILTGSMGKASLYHTMSGWGTPAEGLLAASHTFPSVQNNLNTKLLESTRKWTIHTHTPRAWQGISTTFSISAVMCFSGSFINCGGSEGNGEADKRDEKWYIRGKAAKLHLHSKSSQSTWKKFVLK